MSPLGLMQGPLWAAAPLEAGRGEAAGRLDGTAEQATVGIMGRGWATAVELRGVDRGGSAGGP
eukprot:7327475-Alexandrium_andersonii.AAC.1